jgi:lysophospholipase L1-like esterase
MGILAKGVKPCQRGGSACLLVDLGGAGSVAYMAMHRLGRFLRDCAISLAVAVALLVVVEIVLRVFAPQLPRTEAAASRALPDSLLGYRYRPNSTARHITPEFDVHYRIDENGVRQRDQPVPADSSAMRILAVGDSFTFGDGNEENDTWLRVAERAVRAKVGPQRHVDVEIINAGVEGYDTRSELLWLEELTPKIRPAIVVLGFVANDVYTNQPVTSPPPPMLHQAGAAFALHSMALAKRLVLQSDRLYANLFLVTARRKYYATAPDSAVTRQMRITRDLLHAMAVYCREHDMQLVVVSIPQQYEVISVARNLHVAGIDPAIVDEQLAPTMRADGCVWIEALPRLAAVYGQSHRDMFYRVDGHLTREGNRVLGQLVAATLIPRAWGVQPH